MQTAVILWQRLIRSDLPVLKPAITYIQPKLFKRPFSSVNRTWNFICLSYEKCYLLLSNTIIAANWKLTVLISLNLLITFTLEKFIAFFILCWKTFGFTFCKIFFSVLRRTWQIFVSPVTEAPQSSYAGGEGAGLVENDSFLNWVIENTQSYSRFGW